MITKVVLSSKAQKQVDKLPVHIRLNFIDWVEAVTKYGLMKVRITSGFHDEPLKGKLFGLRSIRLNKSYRAYYRVIEDKVKFVRVEKVDKHEY